MKLHHAKLSFNQNGTPCSDAFDDVYYSKDDGLAESRFVFIDGNDLMQQWQNWPNTRFCIGETGFGTGLNFMLTCRLFEQFLSDHPNAPLQHLHFVSLEKYPIEKRMLEAIHQQWPDLHSISKALIDQYPPALEGIHRSLYTFNTAHHITLDLVLDDVMSGIAQVPRDEAGLVNAWYLDGFAPSKNQSMWHDDVYKQMAYLSAPNATLATFTAAGAVKRGLLAAGFSVHKIKGFGRKREMIKAVFSSANQDLKKPSNTIPAQAPYFNRHQQASYPKDAHIAVVGAGIAGAMLALRLVEQGKRVSLICKDKEPAQGASGNPVGGFYPQLNAEAGINSQFFVHAFLYARRFYDSLLAKGIHFDHHWCGVLQLAFNDNTQLRLDKMQQRELWPDELAQVINAQQASAIAGVPLIQNALHIGLGGWIAPISLVKACLAHAEKTQRLRLRYEHTLSAYKSLEDEKSGVELTLQMASGETHKMHADALVMAAGADTDSLCQHKLPMRLTRGQVEAMPAHSVTKNLKAVLCHKGYFTPAVNGHHALGSSYVKDDMNTEHRQAEVSSNIQMHKKAMKMSAWVDALEQQEKTNISGRAAIRCSTPDHLPMVGALPDIDRQRVELADLYKALPLSHYAQGSKHQHVFVLSGLGSRGITTAPILVDTLVAQICQQPLPLSIKLLDALSPNRFLVRELIRQQPSSD
ncbi:bifunctional tRNA (5-methylaminomethyl-2-thiouridine)(34)-methyltransferase MnmD/FAD-dependent 5-carboxymethylaminomethyl-2-thiouridine(34) oxidoreductase MnmC [Glaciecola siphonariae]|uniref:tRNA 5-methylaminomethyl-2-thiouridine biosynthesis bifunctional protein MnmC n=1 Tax=Glaciecola siphonariae TaxID=521012 RepID=A0ABV9LTB6_9ALTE